MDQTTSLSNRVFENKSGYQLPKDGPEHDRLDGQSQGLLALMNRRPFHAPMSDCHTRTSETKRILDIGCGTGGMTNLLAAVYPTAHVIGVDIAPVPESRHRKLPNVEYVQGDIRDLMGEDPRFQMGSFDYIFQRLLMFGMTYWPRYTTSITGLLKTGGWMEFHEIDMQLVSETDERVSDKWWHYREFRSDATKLGLDVEIASKLKAYFESAGTLEHINESSYRFPPDVRPEMPDLKGLSGQIPALFEVVYRKVLSATRYENQVEEVMNDLHSTFKQGFQPGDRYRVFAVIGQKKVD